MAIVSVTRLQLRSARFLLGFIVHAARSRRQAMATAGCLHVQVRRTRGLSFWTISMWDGEESLRRFLSEGDHRRAMARLPGWCDEAAVVHWSDAGAQLPSWESAAARLQQSGRLVAVLHPSARQRSGEIPVS
jgi:hypothetical protein